MDAISEDDSKYSKANMLEIIFPGNTNSLGTAFGGHMLSLMDKAAAFAAGRYSLTAVVTASIFMMLRKKPQKKMVHWLVLKNIVI